MAKLKVILKADTKQGAYDYNNEVNALNYKDIALILKDLKRFNIPIEKAIKEFNIKESDWDNMLSLN
jgi:hypothetical protein